MKYRFADILNNVGRQHFQYDTGTIDVHLHSLRRKLGFDNQHPIETIRNVGIILHSQPKQLLHTLNIQEFAIQWIADQESDFQTKQLTPHLHLDPFVSEITISPQNLRQMLDGILQVLLPVSHPGIIRIKSHLGHLCLRMDWMGAFAQRAILTKCWWAFALLGIGMLIDSLFANNTYLSVILGVIAFSIFWSILELFQQEKRVQRGWFPKNPAFYQQPALCLPPVSIGTS